MTYITLLSWDQEEGVDLESFVGREHIEKQVSQGSTASTLEKAYGISSGVTVL